MKVPKDQPLFFTVFSSVCVFVTLLFWVGLPVHYHGHEEEVIAQESRTPEEIIHRAEEILNRVEETIEKVEAKPAQQQPQEEMRHETGRQREQEGSPEDVGTRKENGSRQPSHRTEEKIV